MSEADEKVCILKVSRDRHLRKPSERGAMDAETRCNIQAEVINIR